MTPIQVAYEIVSASRKLREHYEITNTKFDMIQAHMYSIFECYAHGIIGWDQVQTMYHHSLTEYAGLYADDKSLYLQEKSRAFEEYERVLREWKSPLDEYRVISEQKMISNIVVKKQISESVAQEHSNQYFNRNLNERDLHDVARLKTWKRVMEAYPVLIKQDESRVRMLTIMEAPTMSTTQLVTSVVNEYAVDKDAINNAVGQAMGASAPATSLRPKARPSSNVGSTETAPNGQTTGSTRGLPRLPEDVSNEVKDQLANIDLSIRDWARRWKNKSAGNPNDMKAPQKIEDLKAQKAALMKKHNISEEANLDESITKLSNARLKYHATKEFPHGSYTNAEIKDEHKRRMKTEPNYHSAKPSLSEEDDSVDEAKTKPGHNMRAQQRLRSLMSRAIDDSKAKRGVEDDDDVADKDDSNLDEGKPAKGATVTKNGQKYEYQGAMWAPIKSDGSRGSTGSVNKELGADLNKASTKTTPTKVKVSTPPSATQPAKPSLGSRAKSAAANKISAGKANIKATPGRIGRGAAAGIGAALNKVADYDIRKSYSSLYSSTDNNDKPLEETSSAGSTSSGSIASVAKPVGKNNMVRRKGVAPNALDTDSTFFEGDKDSNTKT